MRSAHRIDASATHHLDGFRLGSLVHICVFSVVKVCVYTSILHGFKHSLWIIRVLEIYSRVWRGVVCARLCMWRRFIVYLSSQEPSTQVGEGKRLAHASLALVIV